VPLRTGRFRTFTIKKVYKVNDVEDIHPAVSPDVHGIRRIRLHPLMIKKVYKIYYIENIHQTIIVSVAADEIHRAAV
jgi:ribosomal protein L19